MIEFTTLLTLAILFLIFFRPGKTPPLENPLVIERPGQYHMTLAPQLNLAQPYIEDVANRLSGMSSSDCATVFFELRDRQVTAHGFDFYLLAISRRSGMLLFQAARPVSKEGEQRKVIGEFAQGVLKRFPGSDEPCDEIATAAKQAAEARGMEIKVI